MENPVSSAQPGWNASHNQSHPPTGLPRQPAGIPPPAPKPLPLQKDSHGCPIKSAASFYSYLLVSCNGLPYILTKYSTLLQIWIDEFPDSICHTPLLSCKQWPERHITSAFFNRSQIPIGLPRHLCAGRNFKHAFSTCTL